jgi:hypothetical protein
MKINCLGCGFKIDLSGGYDDFIGPIKCFTCGAIMEIATQGGSLRTVRPLAEAPLTVAEELFELSHQ